MENDGASEEEDDSDHDFVGFQLGEAIVESDFFPEEEEEEEDSQMNETEDNLPADDDVAPFDTDLPQLHRYLGDSLETVSGRVFLFEGSTVMIPLLSQTVTVVPGQTFPLTVTDRATKSMLRAAISADHTFGTLSKIIHRRHYQPLYGTTIEIDEYSDVGSSINIKATARQRFKVHKIRRTDSDYMKGLVEILPEIVHADPLCKVSSLGRFRYHRRKWCRRKEADITAWPSWIYNMYDPKNLVLKVHKDMAFLSKGVDIDAKMPYDPGQLSWWIARHADTDTRSFLLSLNSPIQRLRWQLSSMSGCERFTCVSCNSVFADQDDVIAMSREGSQQTYVNPGGALHDTLTLSKAFNLVIISSPRTEFSWFPGYAWSIAECRHCHQHAGWRFDATTPKMIPRRFWGLTRSSLRTLKDNHHQTL